MLRTCFDLDRAVSDEPHPLMQHRLLVRRLLVEPRKQAEAACLSRCTAHSIAHLSMF